MDPKHSSRAIIYFLGGIFVLWIVISLVLSFVANQEEARVPENIPTEDTFIVFHRFDGVTHSYRGSLDLPTPCHMLAAGVEVTTGASVKATIALTVVEPSPDTICAQVISKEEFSVALSSLERPEVALTVNGDKRAVSVVEEEL